MAQTNKAAQPNPEKPVEEWVTGDEPMTGPQESYLKTLSHEAGEELPEDLTKAEASVKIEELQEKTGRGK
ncbi:MAG: DUF3072 domain-containing protein [Chthoniobacteraceae bacterium]